MLLIGSPGTSGPIEVDLRADGEADPKGRAVLARGLPEREYGRFVDARAAVVLFTADERFEGPVADDEAVPFGEVEAREWGPVALRLSRTAERRLRELLAGEEPVVLRVEASVRVERSPIEMLPAEIRCGPLPASSSRRTWTSRAPRTTRQAWRSPSPWHGCSLAGSSTAPRR